MQDVVKNLLEKISSYEIFNNFFPGIIFCIIVEKTTRISFCTGEIWERLFIYYFIGMIISRVGSIFVEKKLGSIKVKNKKTKVKEKFIKFAPYSDYIEASENISFIKILNETNNTYRTIIAMFVAVMCTKLYDWFLYDMINNFGVVGNNIIFLIICLLITMLFIHSYKKQTDYIRKRVEKYIKSKSIEKQMGGWIE